MQQAEQLQQTTSHEIEAVMGKVLYRDPVTNRPKIAVMKSENIPKFAREWMYPNSFIAIGNLPNAEKLRVRLQGKWDRDKRRGWRFLADYYEEVIPETPDAMIEYLSSGLLKGVGPKTAEAIVNHFGDDTIDILKNDPIRLAEVKGISAKKAEAIASSYQSAAHLEELMLLLKPYFITTGKIVKIYEKYGKKAVETIKKNPYKLCDDIDGIGFKIADKIARSVGISPEDDYRIRAGLLYTLSEASQGEGHLYLPFPELIRRAKRTLETSEVSGAVNQNDIIRVAIDMMDQDELVFDDEDVYLPIYYASERLVANKIRSLMQAPKKTFKVPFDKIIPEIERKFNLTNGYDETQKEALRALEKGNVLIVTGGPGTGKTTIVKGIIEIFKQNSEGRARIALCAPTGRAAKRLEEATGVEGRTIHRLLEYRPNNDNGNGQCGRNEHNPIDADVIICDEFSMVDILLFSSFLKAIKPGTTFVIVGDVDQLPSVGPGNVLRDLIESGQIPTVRLTEIHRQADTSKIIINAAKIREGDTDLEWDENFEFIDCKSDEIPGLIKEKFVAAFDEVRDIFDVQALSPFRRKTESGSDALNNLLQNALNPKRGGEAEIKVGAQVFRKHDKIMQLKNNPEKDIFNGDLGLIKGIEDKTSLTAEIDEELILFENDDLYELGLAYCTTIHKSQGSEYHTIIIPVTFQHRIMLVRNLIYTGITRAKVRVVLVGERDALTYAIKNNRVSCRNSKLRVRLQSYVSNPSN